MNKSLLHKTSKMYLIFALGTLLLFAPVFYFFTNQLYLKDADDSLILQKEEFLKYYQGSFEVSEIEQWNKFNRDVKIKASTINKTDSLFYTFYYDSLSKENEPYRELHSHILIEGKPFMFSARINLVESEDLIQHIFLLFLTLSFCLLLGIYFITKWLSKQIWRPFYKALDIIENFEIDKTRMPDFQPADVREFNQLNKSLEKLLSKNSLIYKNQREFIENAAHELQTPIAVFQAKIDTLIQDENLTENQTELLFSIHENTARLSRLNKNLLLLSKIENDSFLGKQSFVLNELIEKNHAFFEEQALSKNIQILFDFKNHVSLVANQTLTEVLVSNLLLNAIRHNHQNGYIHVEIKENKLKIENSGVPLAIPKEKLFQRFSKLNSAEKGTGLGLSIAKKIADSNGWNLQYFFINNSHLLVVEF